MMPLTLELYFKIILNVKNCTSFFIFRDANPNSLNAEFGNNVDFSLKKGQKITINMGAKKKEDNPTNE